MPGLIGRKSGMTSIFDENGKNIPCTVLRVGPCLVTQVKTMEKDGYEALQLGYEDRSTNRCNQAAVGHHKKSGGSPKKKLVEFKRFEKKYKPGDLIKVDIFEEGEYVDVSAISKGKGFQGVVKRHGFKGVGDASHGQHNRLRAPGSIGAASYPARVFKGLKMAGRTGNHKVKIINLKVIKIDKENDVILVKGAVPGHNKTWISIEK